MPPRKPLWGRGRAVRRGDKYVVAIPIEDVPHYFGREVEIAECANLHLARVVIHRCAMAQAALNAANMMIDTAKRCREKLLDDEPTINVIEELHTQAMFARRVLDGVVWAPSDTSVADAREIPQRGSDER